MRILIADDDVVSALMLRRTLERWGYTVTMVTDGTQALAALQKPDAPKLMILDWMMPGLDGPEVIRAVRSQASEHYNYAILLTSRDQQGDIVEGLEAGADDYIRKPFDSNELRARLRAGQRILDLQSRLLVAKGEVHRVFQPGSNLLRIQASGGVTLVQDGRRRHIPLKSGVEVRLSDTYSMTPIILETGQTSFCITSWQCCWSETANRDVFGLCVVERVGEWCIRFRWIPPGSFFIGSSNKVGERRERPQHRVVVTGGFWLGSTTVTQGLWSSVMLEKPNHINNKDHPVVGISWYDAIRFCNALSERLGLEAAYEIGVGENPLVRLIETSWGFRLPTEAEWEYACRAGTTTHFWSGDNEDDLKRVGWFDDNAKDSTHPVGEKPANPWGLYDMHGNVWEWCQDACMYGDSYSGESSVNPYIQRGPHRSVRGGSWLLNAHFSRAAYRNGSTPSSRSIDIGFRLARGPVQVRGAPEKGRTLRPRLPEARRDAGGLMVLPVRDKHGTGFEFSVGDTQYLLRSIDPGSFLMGSPDNEEERWDDEGPQHTVHLTLGFQLGSTPVTQGLWLSLMPENPSRFKSANRPVEQVSWFDAVRFCNALSAKLGLDEAYEVGEGEKPEVRLIETSWGFRLPTEAEWEYACRAGTTTRFWSGDSKDDLKMVGWFRDNANGSTHPVGKKPANSWGLFDMHGNVREWCQDALVWAGECLQNYNNLSGNIVVSHKGNNRAMRGGSWDESPRRIRSAYRGGDEPWYKRDRLGFRLARGPIGGNFL